MEGTTTVAASSGLGGSSKPSRTPAYELGDGRVRMAAACSCCSGSIQTSAAVGVAVNILLLSDSVPKSAVSCQRAPIADVNTSITEVPSETVTVIESRPLLWTLVIHPGGEEHARQPSHRHATHVSSPSESAPGQIKLEWLQLQSTLEAGLGDFMLSYMPH